MHTRRRIDYTVPPPRTQQIVDALLALLILAPFLAPPILTAIWPRPWLIWLIGGFLGMGIEVYIMWRIGVLTRNQPHPPPGDPGE